LYKEIYGAAWLKKGTMRGIRRGFEKRRSPHVWSSNMLYINYYILNKKEKYLCKNGLVERASILRE
jgi:hypothetical protein